MLWVHSWGDRSTRGEKDIIWRIGGLEARSWRPKRKEEVRGGMTVKREKSCELLF